MKINDSSNNGVSGLNRTQESGSSSQVSLSRSSSSSRGDQVALSSLSSALNLQPSNSPQNSAKLAQLSAAVSTGGYHVDAPALSNSIINSSIRA